MGAGLFGSPGADREGACPEGGGRGALLRDAPGDGGLQRQTS